MSKLNDDDNHFWERDRRQIESIVRIDITRGRGYNNNVAERFPITFVGVDKIIARTYYNLIWNREMNNNG